MSKTAFNKFAGTLLLSLIGLGSGLMAQEYSTPTQYFDVKSQSTVTIEASYCEIEIEEWNKNRVEVTGTMRVQGLDEEEAKEIFDRWEVNTSYHDDQVTIHASGSDSGNEYFFIHNDKYVGNIVVDVPTMAPEITAIIDSIHVVLPPIAAFPDIEYAESFSFSGDFNFDYEKFKSDPDYLKEWQEENAEKIEEFVEEINERNAEISERHAEMRERQMEMEKRAMERQKEAIERQAELMKKQEMRMEEIVERAEAQAERAEAMIAERETEIRRILEERQKVKVKRILKIKVPKNAKLVMDVDYCKITTIK